MTYVAAIDAVDFIASLDDNSVPLILTDPPFYGIVDAAWDNNWRDEKHFAEWLSALLLSALPKLTPDGSLVFFAGIGKHGEHPLFRVIVALEDGGYTYRNWVTWRKRRAYGKEFDYLYTREEILWCSRSPVRTEVRFHKPYTAEIRGYDGFGEYKAHSDYKRVSNVWTDLEDPGTVIDDVVELFRPKRVCQKPPILMQRLIETHSNVGDLVVDPFAGYGSTGIEAVKLGRDFRGSEAIVDDALSADARVTAAAAEYAKRQRTLF